MTLNEAKDLIAVKYGHESWEAWGYAVSEPYGHSIPEQYQTEAAELYAGAAMLSAAFKGADDKCKQLFLDQFLWGRSILYTNEKTGETRVIDPTSEEASKLFMGLLGGWRGMNRFGIIPKGAKLLSFAPYYVTKDGKTVFSMLTGKAMKQHITVSPTGQQTLKVCLRHKDGTKHWHSVHRLVASLFVVNYKVSTHKTVKHKDNDVFNNSYTNLVWSGGRGKQPKSARLSTTGERHYGFAGWYVYGSVRCGSLRQLAQALGTYPMQMTRLLKRGLIKFEAK